jgi:hypothetical protein
MNPLALARTLSLIFELQPFLKRYVEALKVGIAVEFARELGANACEVRARWLFKFSEVPIFGTNEHLKAARAYAGYADTLAPNDSRDPTRALVKITRAEIALKSGALDSARRYFVQARDLESYIEDQNQRSRVLRSLAQLSVLLYDSREWARSYLDKADSLNGIDQDVRDKNAEMRKMLGL